MNFHSSNRYRAHLELSIAFYGVGRWTGIASAPAAHLELRLDERDDRLSGRWPQHLRDTRQHERERDERDVDDGEVARLGHEPDIHVAHVLALEHDDAWILAERPGELAIADVDRV